MIRFANRRVLSQILLWSVSWLLISFFQAYGFVNFDILLRRGLASTIGIALVIVINMQLLLPHLYLQKKTGQFILAGMALLLISVLVIHSDAFPWSEWFNYSARPGSSVRDGMRPGRTKEAMAGFRWLRHMMPFIMAFLGSSLVEISRFANRKEKEAIRTQKEKMEAELKFLKSQVNPHFLFNALNNIYSLTLTQAPQAPQSVMQLSEVLRYMVYYANEDKVPLKSEINYIENYINLMLLKDSKGMDVKVDLDRSAPDLMIAPLLFIPFVENAFKHSKTEKSEIGYIRISMKINNNEIIFSVVNNISQNGSTKDKEGGVGLENITKRLELLYPGNRHDLEISTTKDQFAIRLIVDTNDTNI